MNKSCFCFSIQEEHLYELLQNLKALLQRAVEYSTDFCEGFPKFCSVCDGYSVGSVLADTTRSMNDAILLPAQVLWQALPLCSPTSCTVTDATKNQQVVWIFLFTHPPLTPIFVAVVLFKQSHSASFGKAFKHLVVEGEK